MVTTWILCRTINTLGLQIGHKLNRGNC
jgi:hypothetical protein